MKGKDDIVYDVDYDNLLSAFPHHVVLVLHPRGTDYPMNNFRMASTKMTAALLGADARVDAVMGCVAGSSIPAGDGQD